IAGPKSTTEPQPGLDTKGFLWYMHMNWRDANNVPFDPSNNWLQPVVNKTINRRPDAFSPRLGQECQSDNGFPYDTPTEALFDPKQVVIVSNGRCGSACSLFSVTMVKHEGSRTVVLGGKQDVAQQYCGTVGGQVQDFRNLDIEIKTTKLKGHALAPPDL
ncbi:hypothetical protein EST38_g6941, partial [Candolleomyces aberdarensis]